MNQRTANLLAIVVAITGAMLSGWLAWASNEVLPAVVSTFVFGAILGALSPKLGLVLAPVVGSSVAAFYYVSERLGFPSKWPPEPNIYASLIAVIPAMVGFAFGVIAFGTWRSLKGGSTSWGDQSQR